MTDKTWTAMFDAVTSRPGTDAIREQLGSLRSQMDDATGSTDDHDTEPELTAIQGPTPNPAAVVPDADVFAADLLAGGPSRAALDCLRSHSWMALVTSPRLLGDAQELLEAFEDAALVDEWREKIHDLATVVNPGVEGHPAIAAAHAGNAAQVLTLDDRLTGATAGVAIRRQVAASAKTPAAFVATVDMASLYGVVHDTDPTAYPGPDRDPGE